MAGRAFIRLNSRGLNLETAKQTKLDVVEMLKVLRIGRFARGRMPKDRTIQISVVLPQILLGMANLSENAGFVS
jgi:hypothetical protein